MPKPSEIAPEDCPEPYHHEVFRYCPACSWTEEYGKSPTRFGVRMWGLTKEQRDILLSLSREWDSFFEEHPAEGAPASSNAAPGGSDG